MAIDWLDGALKELRHLTQAGQINLVRRLNDAQPLEAAEWDAAHKAMGWFGSVVPVVLDLPDRDRRHSASARRNSIALATLD